MDSSDKSFHGISMQRSMWQRKTEIPTVFALGSPVLYKPFQQNSATSIVAPGPVF